MLCVDATKLCEIIRMDFLQIVHANGPEENSYKKILKKL